MCVRPYLRACDPVCEDGFMLDQMDRWTDRWTDGLIDVRVGIKTFVHYCCNFLMT